MSKEDFVLTELVSADEDPLLSDSKDKPLGILASQQGIKERSK